MDLFRLIIPELILAGTACGLFLFGLSSRPGVRRAVPVVALAALIAAFGLELARVAPLQTEIDPFETLRITHFTQYIRLLTAGIGVLFVLMFWPTNRDATGNGSLDFGQGAGEFFALLLLSLTGVLLVAGADDMILLFLGIELASIPTYIMVSVSRPQAVAQEAGVKYFFLGALAAALMLFGFSYLYGSTGTTSLREVTEMLAATMTTPNATVQLSGWQMLATIMLVAGFAFKLAAVPLHMYAADVYQGAATPVTAMLSFVPKAAGIVALIKLLFVIGGGAFAVTPAIVTLLWVLAVLTMTVGNVLGLLQFNVKRVLAYSSIAHSGYMLAGLTAAVSAWNLERFSEIRLVQDQALAGVLFYLAAYGIMNAGAFGVLMMLPRRGAGQTGAGGAAHANVATTAETFEDLAGQGRRHLALGLAMAISCFSLIGLPLTVGFFGKLYLIIPALNAQAYWLVVLLLINAAISAAYYLRIVGTMFLRDEPSETDAMQPWSPPSRSVPIAAAVALSVVGTLVLGIVFPATQALKDGANTAAQIDERILPAMPGAVSADAPSAPQASSRVQ